MQVELGTVLEGRVSGITNFGAFISLPEGQKGLVHISEIANSYVNDINEHLKVGQTVKVKVIAINGDKISLSIKKAEAPQQPAPVKSRPAEVSSPSGDAGFEDKLKKFMQESDSRIAGNPIYADRGKSRRKR